MLQPPTKRSLPQQKSELHLGIASSMHGRWLLFTLRASIRQQLAPGDAFWRRSECTWPGEKVFHDELKRSHTSHCKQSNESE